MIWGIFFVVKLLVILGNILCLTGYILCLTGNILCLTGNILCLTGNILCLTGNILCLTGNILCLTGCLKLWVTYFLVVEIFESSGSSGSSGKSYKTMVLPLPLFQTASQFCCRTFDSRDWFYPLTSGGKSAIVSSRKNMRGSSGLAPLRSHDFPNRSMTTIGAK
jgi:hypothetical protein